MKRLDLIPLKILVSKRIWNVRDRHDLRVFLRKIRVQLWLSKRLKHLSVTSKKLSELAELSENLLDACGKIRDIDVLFQTLRYFGLEHKVNKRKLAQQRNQLIEELQQQWPQVRRRRLAVLIRWFAGYLEVMTLVLDQRIQKKHSQLLKKLTRKRPKTKQAWHNYRRRLRRLNYLNALMGERNSLLIKFQKILGYMHDLEALSKRISKKDYPFSTEKKLEKKMKKYSKYIRDRALNLTVPCQS